MISSETIQKEIRRVLTLACPAEVSDVGITVKNGVVTLYGTLESDIKKHKVEKTIKAVRGVSAIVDQIVIGDQISKQSDVEITADIAAKIEQKCPFVRNLILKLENDILTIEGEVSYTAQKDSVTSIASSYQNLRLKNNIEVGCEKIKLSKVVLFRALKANTELDESHIDLAVTDHEVTLDGYVNSLFEKELAGHIVQKAPGVATVHNNLKIVHELSRVI